MLDFSASASLSDSSSSSSLSRIEREVDQLIKSWARPLVLIDDPFPLSATFTDGTMFSKEEFLRWSLGKNRKKCMKHVPTRRFFRRSSAPIPILSSGSDNRGSMDSSDRDKNMPSEVGVTEVAGAKKGKRKPTR